MSQFLQISSAKKAVKCIFSAFFLCFLSFNGFAQASKSVSLKQPVSRAKSAKTNPAVVTSKGAAGARIAFVVEKMDLGTLKESAVLHKTFEFTNTGSAPLVILSAEGSCNCTVPTFSKAPIAPGEKGEIDVKYIARNKVGPQKMGVTLVTNGSPKTIKLSLEAWVEQVPGGVKD
jgi:hypothetical protein